MATPFIVSRLPKPRGRKRDRPELLDRKNDKAFALHVLHEECARLRQQRPEVPAPIDIAALPEHRIGARRLLPLQFKRFRRKGSDFGGARPSGAFRITFPHAVAGPICLGHSSHFGMGLFVPEQP